MKLTIGDVELWAEQYNCTIIADEWLKYAQDIICKYEKIERILDDCLLDDWEILKSIREVIEDGKIDG